MVRFILLPDYVPSSSRSGGLTRAAVFLGSRASSPQTVLVASLSRACRGLEARAPRKPMAHRVGVRMRIVRNQVASCNSFGRCWPTVTRSRRRKTLGLPCRMTFVRNQDQVWLCAALRSGTRQFPARVDARRHPARPGRDRGAAGPRPRPESPSRYRLRAARNLASQSPGSTTRFPTGYPSIPLCENT